MLFFRLFHKSNNVLNVWVVNSAWLYSLYWCMGVNSVTTNFVHTFSKMKAPVWHLVRVHCDTYVLL